MISNRSHLIISLLLIITLINFVRCKEKMEKMWIGNTEILNKDNWEGGKYSEDCKGVILPENFEGVMSIGDVATNEIILPSTYGSLEIRGAVDIIPSQTECIKVKNFEYVQWLTPRYWQSSEGNNTSVPHVERVPCTCDITVFPKNDTFAVEFPPVNVFIYGFKMGTDGTNLMDQEWHEYVDGSEEIMLNRNVSAMTVEVDQHACPERKDGNTCHKHNVDYKFIQETVCDNLGNEEKLSKTIKCVKSIKPIGHCFEICGAILYLHHDTNFDFDYVYRHVPKYEAEDVDTYISVVKRGGKFMSQVVFKEKDNRYSGLSFQKAEHFYNVLVSNKKKYGVLTVEIVSSEYSRGGNSNVGNSFSIIFGTLVAVLVIFGLIIVAYEKSIKINIPTLRFRNLIPWKTSEKTPSFKFTRLETVQEEARLSISTSVLDLDKSFENPMYEEKPQTGPETWNPTLVAVVENKNETTAAFENQNFELTSVPSTSHQEKIQTT